MKQQRLWIVATFVWFFALANVEHVVEPLAIVPFVYLFALLCAVPLLLIQRLRRNPVLPMVVAAVASFVLLKMLSGNTVLGEGLTQSLVEALAISITIVLARGLGHQLDEFEEAVEETMTAHLPTAATSFDASQGEIYSEVRRARTYQRPLSMLAISTRELSEERLHRLVAEVQRDSLERYVHARLGALLAEEMRDYDILAVRDDHFVTMLPETEAEQAMQLVQRLRSACREQLGLDLNIGISSFPDQEVTFEKLLESAELAMRDSSNHPTEEAQPVAAGDGDTEDAELTG